MVDAVNLVFSVKTRHVVIDFSRRLQIRTQRFFQHYAHIVGIQADCRQIFTGLREELGRGRKVDNNVFGHRALFHCFAQPNEVFRLGNVQRQISNAVDKRLPLRLGKMILDVDFGICFDFGEKFGSIEFTAAHAQNAAFGMQQSGDMGLIQARQQLAHGQISRSAEQNQVEIGLCIHHLLSFVNHTNLYGLRIGSRQCLTQPADHALIYRKIGSNPTRHYTFCLSCFFKFFWNILSNLFCFQINWD